MEADFTFRLSDRPHDVYAAFDFFVAAEHLPEWLGKAQFAPGAPENPRAEALRRLSKQLANGAKHFTVAVPGGLRDAYEAPPTVYGTAVYGASRYGDTAGNLVIVLEDDEARALGRETLSAVELAGMVLTYWKKHPAIDRAARLARAAVADEANGPNQ
jgi:hypothetical protein